MMLDFKTTMNVKPQTVERLKQYKITKGDSYNNVLVRLLNKHMGDENGKI